MRYNDHVNSIRSSGQGASPYRWYSPRAERQIRCDSEADSIVWMKEDSRRISLRFYYALR